MSLKCIPASLSLQSILLCQVCKLLLSKTAFTYLTRKKSPLRCIGSAFIPESSALLRFLTEKSNHEIVLLRDRPAWCAAPLHKLSMNADNSFPTFKLICLRQLNVLRVVGFKLSFGYSATYEKKDTTNGVHGLYIQTNGWRARQMWPQSTYRPRTIPRSQGICQKPRDFKWSRNLKKHMNCLRTPSSSKMPYI